MSTVFLVSDVKFRFQIHFGSDSNPPIVRDLLIGLGTEAESEFCIVRVGVCCEVWCLLIVDEAD